MPDILQLRHSTIAIARGWVGQHEVPMGSNRGPLPDRANTFVGGPMGSPWCCATIMLALHQAGVKNLPKTGSTGAMIAYYKSHGALVDTPQFGDVFGVKGDTATGYEHTGMVIGGPLTALQTIEFNMSNEGIYNVRDGSTGKETFANPYLNG